MSGKRPVFVMIAGPNGSGKSSITKELQEIQSDFPSHYINADEIKALVAFLQNGVADRTAFYNADNTVKGNATHGKAMYGSVCHICHGDDGRARNFADPGTTEGAYIGTLAVDEPQTLFHVLTVGEPGANMPAGMNLGWSQQDIADLLAYLQTLPTK